MTESSGREADLGGAQPRPPEPFRSSPSSPASPSSASSPPAPHEQHGLTARSQHCLIFAVDIAEFGHRSRDDEIQLAVRAAMYRLLDESFNASGVPLSGCLHEDRGDGVIIIIPARIPTVTLIDPLLDRLREGLRMHNRLASDPAKIRLRAALHTGEVHRDEHGLAGTALNHLCRLLDAPPLKQALGDSTADLAFIASDDVYEAVIRHSPGLVDPANYLAVAVEVKETRAQAWIHLPGHGRPPEPPIPPGVDEEPMERFQGFVFKGQATFKGDAVAGNKIVYDRRE
jgi:hypothetical protein